MHVNGIWDKYQVLTKDHKVPDKDKGQIQGQQTKNLVGFQTKTKYKDKTQGQRQKTKKPGRLPDKDKN